MEAGQVWDEFAALPIEAQKQVADLITLLRRRYPNSPGKKPAKVTSIDEEPYVGMWSDRTDMQDSTAWMRDLRQREWTR
jgi:hypothetical protein